MIHILQDDQNSDATEVLFECMLCDTGFLSAFTGGIYLYMTKFSSKNKGLLTVLTFRLHENDENVPLNTS